MKLLTLNIYISVYKIQLLRKLHFTQVWYHHWFTYAREQQGWWTTDWRGDRPTWKHAVEINSKVFIIELHMGKSNYVDRIIW